MANVFRHDGALASFDNIVNWGGDILDYSEVNKLVVGDIVRIMVKNKLGASEKYYVQITQIDRYKYGGIHKPRKFRGKTIDVYLLDWWFVNEGSLINFRKENICEIPNWKGKNSMLQKNIDKLNKYMIRQQTLENLNEH